MFASQSILAIGISIIVLFTTTVNLLFFGRSKNDKSKESTRITSNIDATSHQTEDEKIEGLIELVGNSSSKQRLIPKDQLEKSKRELRRLLLEKEIVSGALTRLYEAEAAKEISKDEREIIASKYREELKSLDSKIVGIDSLIEVGDLETLRDQLLRLVSEKIEAIERRIERAKISASPMIKDIIDKTTQIKPPDQPKLASDKNDKPPVPDISDLLRPPSSTTSLSSEPSQTESTRIVEPVVPETPQSPRSQSKQRRNGNSDRQVEELQKELLEALDRLEKLDVET